MKPEHSELSSGLRFVRTCGVALGCICIASVAAAQTSRVTVHVDDPRPVAEAVKLLTSKYPVVVTYEDPRYDYSNDLQDVTDLARSLNKRNMPGRVMVPRGGPLDFSYVPSSESNAPLSWPDTLQEILAGFELRSGGGRFTVMQSGQAFHVIPTAVRNRAGEWVDQASILDVHLTIPAQDLNGLFAVNLILEHLTRESGMPVGLGASPLNLLYGANITVEANNERARDVLLAALHSVNERLTWRLLYGPDVQTYALNVRAVAAHPDLDEELTNPLPVGDRGPAFLSEEEIEALQRQRTQE